MGSLDGRLRRLEGMAGGNAGPRWEIPVEALLLLKAVARHHARSRGEEPPAYSEEEISYMHAEDLAIVAGGGVAGELRDSGGWEENGRELLNEWEEGARRRLERVQDGEPLEAVYNELDEEEYRDE